MCVVNGGCSALLVQSHQLSRKAGELSSLLPAAKTLSLSPGGKAEEFDYLGRGTGQLTEASRGTGKCGGGHVSSAPHWGTASCLVPLTPSRFFHSHSCPWSQQEINLLRCNPMTQCGGNLKGRMCVCVCVCVCACAHAHGHPYVCPQGCRLLGVDLCISVQVCLFCICDGKYQAQWFLMFIVQYIFSQ